MHTSPLLGLVRVWGCYMRGWCWVLGKALSALWFGQMLSKVLKARGVAHACAAGDWSRVGPAPTHPLTDSGRHPARREWCSLCGADFWDPEEELPSKISSLPELLEGSPSLFERGDPTRPCLSRWGSSCHLPIIFLLLSFCVCFLLFLSLPFFLPYLFILLFSSVQLLSRVQLFATP